MTKFTPIIILNGLLLGLSTFAFGADASAIGCSPSLSKNCSCVAPILVRQLGEEQARIVVQAWIHSFMKDEVQREAFFKTQSSQLNVAMWSYGQIKYFIGFQCGTLDFDDDYQLIR